MRRFIQVGGYAILVQFIFLLASSASISASKISIPTFPERNSTSLPNPPLPISYQGVDHEPNRALEPSIAPGNIALVIAMNYKVTVYTKENPGVLLYQEDFSSFYSSVANYGIFDPVARYDKKNGRFVVLAIANKYDQNKSFFAIATSKNSYPRSINDWCFFYSDASKFGTGQEYFAADRPSMTLNPYSDILYITANMYTHDASKLLEFQYSKLRTLKLSTLYNDCGPTSVEGTDFKGFTHENNLPVFNMQTVHRTDDGPAYFIATVNGTSNVMSIFSLENVINPPPGTRIPVPDLPNYAATISIRQPGGLLSNKSQSMIMQAEYRNGAIWAIQDTKDHDFGGVNASVRIYKYTGTAPTQVQYREENGTDYSFGAIAVNKNDQALIAFNISSPTRNIGIRYADLSSVSADVKPGLGVSLSQTWGDYALIATDSNDIDFWIVHLYAKANGETGVWIASTKAASSAHFIYLPQLIK